MTSRGGIKGGTAVMALQIIRWHYLEWLGLMLLAFGFEFLIASMLSTTTLRQNMAQFLSMMPGVFQAFLGGKNMNLLRPEGMLTFGYSHPMMQVLLSVLIFTIATRHIAGRIERKTIDLILSRAISRHQYFAAVIIAALVGTLILCAVSWLGIAAATWILTLKVKVSLLPLARIALDLWLLCFSGIGIATLISVYNSQGRIALGIMIGVWVFLTIVDLTSKLIPSLSFLGPYTPLYYHQPYKLLDSWSAMSTDAVVQLGTFLVMGTLAWRRFATRDL